MTKFGQSTLIGLILVAMAAFGFYGWRNLTDAARGTVATSTLPGATTTIGSDIQVISTDGVTITEIPDDSTGASIPAFDFMKPIAFASSVSAEVRAALSEDLKRAQDALSADDTDFNAWMQLGSDHHLGGDNKEAEAIWLYATELFPNTGVPYDNLGNLYLDYLKDYPKAEQMFKKSLSIDSHNTAACYNLVALYTDYGYKANTSAAPDMLDQCLKNNPGAYDVATILARYYVKESRTAEAKAIYDKAIAAAQYAGNTQAKDALIAEKNQL